MDLTIINLANKLIVESYIISYEASSTGYIVKQDMAVVRGLGVYLCLIAGNRCISFVSGLKVVVLAFLIGMVKIEANVESMAITSRGEIAAVKNGRDR